MEDITTEEAITAEELEKRFIKLLGSSNYCACILSVNYKRPTEFRRGIIHGMFQSGFALTQYYKDGQINEDLYLHMLGEICKYTMPLKYWIPVNHDNYSVTPPNGFCGYILQLQMYLHYDGRLTNNNSSSSSSASALPAGTSQIPPVAGSFAYSKTFKDIMEAELKRLQHMEAELKRLQQLPHTDVDTRELRYTIYDLKKLLDFVNNQDNETMNANFPKDYWPNGCNMCNFFFPKSYPRVMFVGDPEQSDEDATYRYVHLTEARRTSDMSSIRWGREYTYGDLVDYFRQQPDHPYIGCLNGLHFFPLPDMDFKFTLKNLELSYRQIIKEFSSLLQKFTYDPLQVFSKPPEIEERGTHGEHHGLMIDLISPPKSKSLSSAGKLSTISSCTTSTCTTHEKSTQTISDHMCLTEEVSTPVSKLLL